MFYFNLKNKIAIINLSYAAIFSVISADVARWFYSIRKRFIVAYFSITAVHFLWFREPVEVNEIRVPLIICDLFNIF